MCRVFGRQDKNVDLVGPFGLSLETHEGILMSFFLILIILSPFPHLVGNYLEAPQTAFNYARSDPVPSISGAQAMSPGIQEKPTTVITSMASATGPMRRSQAQHRQGWRGS